MAKNARRTPNTRQVYGMMIGVKRRGKRPAPQIYPKEFTRFEVAAIGVMTVQWAYLEHMLLIATAKIVDDAKLAMPDEATSISFERRVKAFRDVVRAGVKDDWKRERLLQLSNRISNIQNDRHKVTHGMWDWYPSRPTKLRVSSYRPPFAFEDNFDLPRLAKLCDRFGGINYELTYQPRRGLKTIKIQPEDMAHMSRRFLIEMTEDHPEKFGLEPIAPVPDKVKALLAKEAAKA